MPSLKDLRNRIRSVRSTQKITAAMKMVAASRLRRAQEQAEAARPYAQRMERVLAFLAPGIAGQPPAPPSFSRPGEGEREPMGIANPHPRAFGGGDTTNLPRASS